MCNVAEIEAKMKEINVFTMASGLVGDEMKFYYHCQTADLSGYGFAEIVFKQGFRTISGAVKTTRGDLGVAILTKFEKQLRNFAA